MSGGDRRASRRLHEMLRIVRKQGVLGNPTPEKLRHTLEELGPTYVKFGQILSMRPDMLPREYCKELEKLRTGVKPMPFSEVEAVIEREQGRPVSAVFATIEREPLGSASIAQVHAATLPGGRRVVIKAQRPNIYDVMEQDVELLRRAMHLLGLVSELGGVVNLTKVIDEMWAAAQQEMDFLTEAAHLEHFAELNAETKFISCPSVVRSLTTKQMLVMDDVGGFPIDDLARLDEGGYDVTEIGSKLVDNYMKQVLDDGFFHADPHPGNIRIVGGKIVWLDLGMVGELNQRDRQVMGSMIEAVAAGDIMSLKSGLLTLGKAGERVNHPALYTEIDDLIQRYASLDLGSMDLGTIMEELIDTAARFGIEMPASITMLGRGIVTIEGVIAVVCPEVNFVQLAANRAKGHTIDWEHLSENLLKSGSAFAHNVFRAVSLPGQMSDLLKMTVKGQTQIHNDISVSENTLRRFERVGSGLVLGLVTAALWVAGALLSLSPAGPSVWGIPTLPGAVLLLAFGLTLYLLVRLRPSRRKRRKKR